MIFSRIIFHLLTEFQKVHNFTVTLSLSLRSLISVRTLLLPEFTTMAGRRLRDAVKTVLTDGSKSELSGDVHIVIAGLTNSYSQYVTTFEEYQVQRYEVSSPCRG